MTQYKTELYNLYKKMQEDKKQLNPAFRQYLSELDNNNINIFLTDMNEESDGQILTTALLSLQGVSQVKTAISQKRINITYDPKKTTLQSIAYNINKLGYHHIGRG